MTTLLTHTNDYWKRNKSKAVLQVKGGSITPFVGQVLTTKIKNING